MSVHYAVADLFEQPAEAYAHGVNCSGVMGAGIAPLFKSRWPEMFEVYRQACADGSLTVGKVLPWRASDGTVIYNLATQDRPGRYASLGALSTCLRKMLAHAETRQVRSVAVPRIGAGIGGLTWLDVQREMRLAGEASPVELIVVSLP